MKLSMDLMIKIIELYNMIYFIKNFINIINICIYCYIYFYIHCYIYIYALIHIIFKQIVINIK